MKYCYNCDKSIEEDLEVCNECNSKLVGYKYKIARFIFERIAYVGMFVTTAMCILIPIVFFISWLVSLMFQDISLSQYIDGLKIFYTSPLEIFFNLPVYIFVLVFFLIMLIGLIGMFMVSKKVKKQIKVSDE